MLIIYLSKFYYMNLRTFIPICINKKSKKGKNISLKKLIDLCDDASGIIDSVNCCKHLKTRLSDLGLVEGTPIKRVFCSPFGDPVAYEFRGSIMAIRADEACNIYLKYKNTLRS